MNLANWMERMSTILENKMLDQIILPGTHDSAAYQFDPGAHYQSCWLNLAAHSSRLVHKCLKSWMFTQSENIYEQLLSGIRSFDLRVYYDMVHKHFMLVHTFASVPLEDFCHIIKNFLKDYPGEIVLLTVSPDWVNNLNMEQYYGKLLELFVGIFGEMIYPVDNNFPTYGSMRKQGKPIIIIIDVSQNVISPYFWSIDRAYYLWFDIDSVEEYWRLLSGYTPVNDGKYHALYYTLVPQTKRVVCDILGRIFLPYKRADSVYQLSLKLNARFDDLVQYLLEGHPFSSVYFDFPTPRMVRKIIRLNKLIRWPDRCANGS
jgi:hypothetical protein